MIPDPVPTITLDVILQRSRDGEGVWDVVREMGLPVQDTMEAIKRHHSDAIKAAKKYQKENPKPKKPKVEES